jgi:hypothetical protein
LTPLQWALLGVALGVGWWLYSRRRGSSTVVDQGAVTGSPAPLAFNAPGGALGGGLGGVAGHYPDNPSWFSAAVNALVGGGYDPLQASNAITAYLGGLTLTPAQQAMVSLVLGRVGTPPSPPTLGLTPLTPLTGPASTIPPVPAANGPLGPAPVNRPTLAQQNAMLTPTQRGAGQRVIAIPELGPGVTGLTPLDEEHAWMGVGGIGPGQLTAGTGYSLDVLPSESSRARAAAERGRR